MVYDSVYRLTGQQAQGRFPDAGTTLDGLGQIGDPSSSLPVLSDPLYQRLFGYDGAYNLRNAPATGSSAPEFPDNFGTPSPRNQYVNLGQGGQVRTQNYDANGNTQELQLERRQLNTPNPSFGQATVDYDYADRPIRVSYANSTDQTIYRYDPLGRRIEKRVNQGGVLVEHTRYLSDGAREIEEQEHTTERLLARYLHGNRLDELLLLERADTAIPGQFQVRYYHENSLGSIIGLSAQDGSELEHYRYDAYGTPILETADFTPPAVLEARVVGSKVEIDFTESLAPFGLSGGLVSVNGVPAATVTLDSRTIQVPTGVPGITAPVNRATLVVTPAAGVGAGAVTVTVTPTSGNNRIQDVSGNVLAAPVTVGFVPPAVVTSAGVVSTGPRQLGISEVGNPFLFQGRRYDPETGLYYYRNHYYSPRVGRFLQNDPKGYVDGPNLYAAFWNNPVNNVDPFGTENEPQVQRHSPRFRQVKYIHWYEAEKVKRLAKLSPTFAQLVEENRASGMSIKYDHAAPPNNGYNPSADYSPSTNTISMLPGINDADYLETTTHEMMHAKQLLPLLEGIKDVEEREAKHDEWIATMTKQQYITQEMVSEREAEQAALTAQVEAINAANQLQGKPTLSKDEMARKVQKSLNEWAKDTRGIYTRLIEEKWNKSSARAGIREVGKRRGLTTKEDFKKLIQAGDPEVLKILKKYNLAK